MLFRVEKSKQKYLLPNNIVRNIRWRKLSNQELENIKRERQTVSNCYDMAARQALLSSDEGFNLLKNRIFISKNLPNGERVLKVVFNLAGKNKAYRSCCDKYFSLGELMTSCVNQMIKHNPSQKPFFSRFAYLGKSLKCEFNSPKNPFKWYTGIKPISIGVFSPCLSLSSHRAKVLRLFESLKDKTSKDYSLVAVSSCKKNRFTDYLTWHCVAVTDINNQKKTITLMNKRTNEINTASFDEFISLFKGITGLIF